MRLSENAVKVLERRYLKRDEEGILLETPRDMFIRVARNVASAEKEYGKTEEEIKEIEKEFFDIMTDLDFLPNSPTLMNAGKELQQLAACFVLPVGDSMNDIFEALKETALIQKSGGGVGYSFSNIRPKNDVVLSTKGVSSGPISFMTVFNAATDTIKQGGTRRGANMGILRVDHPDILDFITSKEDNDKLTNFNISVGVTEKFMKAVEDDDEYEIINPRTREVVDKYNAKEVFSKIVEHAWKNGDPGIVFLDRLNKDNPTPHLGQIESTNPCGEQPLLPYEACNLGSINLANMVREEEGTKEVNYDKLKKVVHIAVRYLDDVIDKSKYPLDKIDEMALGNRKIGLGVMGYADLLIILGIPYDSEEALELAQKIMSFIQDESKNASKELAKEKGVFPNFKGSVYDSPDGYEIRNATTTTIAPTGTLSIIADCSSGVEPIFAISFIKNVMDNDRLVEVNKYFKKIAIEEGFYSEELMKKIAEKGNLEGVDEVPSKYRRIFVIAHEINPTWHVRTQAVFQKYVDNAVSKTVNFSSEATVRDVEDAYMLAYRLGCKGITIYRDSSRESQVLQVERKEKAAGGKPVMSGEGKKSVGVNKIRPEIPNAKKEESTEEKITPRPRPEVTYGMTKKYKIGNCGKLYVTINSDENGICEVFTNTGEEGCAALTEAVGRLISIAIRSGIDLESIKDQLKGIRCATCIADPETHVLSCPDAIAKAIDYYFDGTDKFELGATSGPRSLVVCPECGEIMEPEGGCYLCRHCGYSKCS
ncbi:MAG: ribonucleotide-diphosphate reductase subunit alpha [delta proteobacterium ML8_D]|nr:MAG: ribonucleotide-diphosphate reductase subunit alpha [delta proteobacterium ML8_D]